MGLLSSSVSITRYKIEGKVREPFFETIANGLVEYAISESEDELSEKTIGWTSFETPFTPVFQGSSFVIGAYLVFSLRIDKKVIPSKVVKKECTLAFAKRLAETGREYLSRNEKRLIKEEIINNLMRRIPATPNMYDLIWNTEESLLYFFSTQKAANEELETLFSKSFNLTLIRLFPYTTAYFKTGLSDADCEVLSDISPTIFTE